MGAGNVDTAINAVNLLGRFPSDLAVSIGPTGGLSYGLTVGSWFRVEKVIGYQRGSLGNAGWAISPTAIRDVPLPSAIARTKISSLAPLACKPLASGDAFVANDSERERIREVAGADAVDMNSFGLVVAAEQVKTPLVIWEIVSDRASESAGDDFKAFIRDYRGEGGRMVREMILGLPTSPSSPESYKNIREALQ